MLHIILTILKIIGITLLAILGIILFLLLIILFVPIRYDIKASKDNKIHVNATVHWILHIITFRFLMEDERQMYLKIFGIKVYPRKAKKNKKVKKKKDDIITDDETDKVVEASVKTTNEEQKPVVTQAKESATDVKEEQEEHIFFFKKIKNKIDNIKNKILGILDTIKRVFKDIKARTSYYVEMLRDESNKRAIGRIWQSVKKLLKAFLPKKHKIYVRFGKEDPASLADIIGYVAIFKSATNINLQFVPVFDEDVLEGKMRLKGNLQLILVLILAFKLYKDKDIRKFLNNFTK